MASWKTNFAAFWALPPALCLAQATPSRAVDTNIETQLHLLQQQNELLQSQLHQQQHLIDSLQQDVAAIHKTDEQRDAEMKGATETEHPSRPAGFNFGNVHLSGEAGAGLFETGSQGANPNAEFRVDEAKLFVDAQVWGDVYALPKSTWPPARNRMSICISANSTSMLRTSRSCGTNPGS